MDPFSAFVLALIMVIVNITLFILGWPFRKLKEYATNHPRRTAQTVLGATAAGLCAYAFHAPYVVEISVSGGVAGLVLGELFS